MKKLSILLLSITITLIVSCTDDTEKKLVEKVSNKVEKQEKEKHKTAKPIKNNAGNTSKVVNDFLVDINTLKEVKKPVRTFIAEADKTAKQKMHFTVDNIEKVLETAKNYKHLVIVVDQHTIVSITDLDKCVISGSWKTCMPYGEGFIKRSSVLNYKKDYCNNIIGRPDEQERVAYFFN